MNPEAGKPHSTRMRPIQKQETAVQDIVTLSSSPPEALVDPLITTAIVTPFLLTNNDYEMSSLYSESTRSNCQSSTNVSKLAEILSMDASSKRNFDYQNIDLVLASDTASHLTFPVDELAELESNRGRPDSSEEQMTTQLTSDIDFILSGCEVGGMCGGE